MPIFVVGFARSGTTLCQSLISQRLVIPTLPETHFFERLDAYEPVDGQISSVAARQLLDEISEFLEIPQAALEPLLAAERVSIRTLFLKLIGAQIGSQALADKGLWLEKTPGHVDNLERIQQMFPKARFICMVRNPLHAFASRRELSEPGKGWGEPWKPIEAFCTQWAQHLQRVRDFAERHPGQLLVLRLEDLADDPDSQLARVREFVGQGFANPINAPLQAGIVQPFETWKQDALRPADPTISSRAGKVLLDEYETWRVTTLLRAEMDVLRYPTDAAPPALDDLHRRLIASIDWYREAFLRRDELMDVKTARIRSLLHERAPDAPPPARPRLRAAAGKPVGTLAKKGKAGAAAKKARIVVDLDE